jgi:transcriptional regulator with XRE-family HTH domain
MNANIGNSYIYVKAYSYLFYIGVVYTVGTMIGFRIKTARVQRQLSQSDLAEIVGVKQPSVSSWERGDTDPTMDNLAMIANSLRVSIEWLGRGIGEMTNESYVPAQVNEHKPMEEELLQHFRKLSWGNQQALLDFVKRWK